MISKFVAIQPNRWDILFGKKILLAFIWYWGTNLSKSLFCSNCRSNSIITPRFYLNCWRIYKYILLDSIVSLKSLVTSRMSCEKPELFNDFFPTKKSNTKIAEGFLQSLIWNRNLPQGDPIWPLYLDIEKEKKTGSSLETNTNLIKIFPC